MTTLETLKAALENFDPTVQTCQEPLRTKKMVVQETIGIAKMFYEVSSEDALSAWRTLKSTHKMFAIHPYIEKLLVNIAIGNPVPTWEEATKHLKSVTEQ